MKCRHSRTALKIILKSIEWRQIHQIDGILDNWTPPEVMKKYYAIGSVGSDKFGCPGKSFNDIISQNTNRSNIIYFYDIVWINAFGRMDMTGLLQSVSKVGILCCFKFRTSRTFLLVCHSSGTTSATSSTPPKWAIAKCIKILLLLANLCRIKHSWLTWRSYQSTSSPNNVNALSTVNGKKSTNNEFKHYYFCSYGRWNGIDTNDFS